MQEENMQTQYSVLEYRNDLYFEYKLAIEVDENVIKIEILTMKYKEKKH